VVDPSSEVGVDPAWRRRSSRTQLTNDTNRAFFVFDRLDALTVDQLPPFTFV
jgi:hypothetical protein